jgi:hypothetical protein
MEHVNLRQVVRPERLWEARGSRLPLRGVIRLRIGIGSLGNLDGPRRRRPAGRNRQICIAGIADHSKALILTALRVGSGHVGLVSSIRQIGPFSLTRLS